MLRLLRIFLLVVAMGVLGAIPGQAQGFDGVFVGQSDDGPTRFELHQAGSQVTGVLVIGKYRLNFAARLEGGKAYGIAEATSAPVRFGVLLSSNGDTLMAGMAVLGPDGQLDAETRTTLSLTRQTPASGSSSTAQGFPGGFANAGGSPRNSLPAEARVGGDLGVVSGRVRSNFAAQGGDVVLAPGNPPLTMASLNAFAQLMRLTFGVEFTEVEFEATRRHFVSYYQQSDAPVKKMLAQGWQAILAEIQASKGDTRRRAIEEVRKLFADSFARGAQAGMPFALTMQATIERRHQVVTQVSAPMPSYAQQAHFNRTMSEADLDASLEMLYFMWVACGRDASLVTPEAVAYVRSAIIAGFPTFTPDIQYVFANAGQVYSQLRGQWAHANPQQRLQMAYGFSAALDALGLVVPSAGGGGEQGGAWSSVSSQSHGEWAASMVQGLAGSSYKSSW